MNGKTRRFPIPPNQRHRDRKNDYSRREKHPHMEVPEMQPLYHWQTNCPLEKASDADYRTTDTCDDCAEVAEGTMYHAVGATGRVCPVLFLCDDCAKSAPKEM